MDSSSRCLLLTALFSVIFAVIVRTSATVNCSVAAVNSCLSELTNITLVTRFLFPPLTMQEYEQYCRRYKLADKCLEKHKKCGYAVRRAKKNTVALLSFMCFSQEDEYIDVGPDCLNKLIMKSELMLCSQSYLGVPESMRAPSKYMQPEVDAFCGLTHDVLYCRYLVLEDHCGVAAARWQHRAYVASYSLILDDFKCAITLNKDFSVERTSMLLFIAVFIGLMILCSAPIRLLFCPPAELVRSCPCAAAIVRRNRQGEKRRQIAMDILTQA